MHRTLRRDGRICYNACSPRSSGGGAPRCPERPVRKNTEKARFRKNISRPCGACLCLALPSAAWVAAHALLCIDTQSNMGLIVRCCCRRALCSCCSRRWRRWRPGGSPTLALPHRPSSLVVRMSSWNKGNITAGGCSGSSLRQFFAPQELSAGFCTQSYRWSLGGDKEALLDLLGPRPEAHNLSLHSPLSAKR